MSHEYIRSEQKRIVRKRRQGTQKLFGKYFGDFRDSKTNLQDY